MSTTRLEKTTDDRERWYDDACGLALGMQLVGDRWTLIVLRELMYGPRRFVQLRRVIPGISASVLTQRLERLEATGVLVRRKLPPPASVQVYELTDWGRESEAMMAALARWAVRSPLHDPRRSLSDASLMMSFRSLLDPARADGIDARIGFAIGEEHFATHLHDGRIEVVRGEAVDAVLSFTAQEAGPIAAAIYDGASLEALEATGALKVHGDRALAERFITLFPVPPKIS